MTEHANANSQAEALRRMGARIAARRKALGLTQKQLAEQLLVSDKAVSKWELGGSYPDPALLVPLAGVLGITVDELLTGRAAPAPADSQPGVSGPAGGAAPPRQGRAAEFLAGRLNLQCRMLLALALAWGVAAMLLLRPLPASWLFVPWLLAMMAFAGIAAVGEWYRLRCRALETPALPLASFAAALLAAVMVFAFLEESSTSSTMLRVQGEVWALNREVTFDLDRSDTRLWLAGIALLQRVPVLPLALLALALVLVLRTDPQKGTARRLLAALPGQLFACGVCRAAAAWTALNAPDMTRSWSYADNLPPDPVWRHYLPVLLAGGVVWLAAAALACGLRARRAGRVAWRGFPPLAGLYLIPAAVDFAFFRMAVQVLPWEQGVEGGRLFTMTGFYLTTPLLLGLAAALAWYLWYIWKIPTTV